MKPITRAFLTLALILTVLFADAGLAHAQRMVRRAPVLGGRQGPPRIVVNSNSITVPVQRQSLARALALAGQVHQLQRFNHPFFRNPFFRQEFLHNPFFRQAFLNNAFFRHDPRFFFAFGRFGPYAGRFGSPYMANGYSPYAGAGYTTPYAMSGFTSPYATSGYSTPNVSSGYPMPYSGSSYSAPGSSYGAGSYQPSTYGSPYSDTSGVGKITGPAFSVPPASASEESPGASAKKVAALEAAADRTAVVLVRVPDALAQVTFNGKSGSSVGKLRSFTTEELQPGKTYHYDVVAHWTESGLAQQATRSIDLKAGQTVTVDFTKER